MSKKQTGKKIDEVKKMNVEVTGKESVMKEGSTLVTKTDLKGRLTYANKDFCEISNYNVEDLIGKPHSVIRNPDMPRSAFFDLWNTIESGKPWNGMVKNRASNGDHYWVDANVAPRIENGKRVGYMSVRRKPSREQVARAEELYRNIREGRTEFPYSDKPRTLLRTKFQSLFGLAAVFPVLFSFSILAPVPWFIPVAISVLVGLALYFFGMRFLGEILDIIKGAAVMGNRIAEGDLSAQVPHNRNDEIGDLQKAILNMLINTAGLIAQIKESSDVLVGTSDSLNEASLNLSAGTEEMSHQSETIAAAATEMNQNLLVVSSSVEEMSISVGEVAQKASEAARIVGQANTEAEATNKIVNELGESAREIGQVIESIASIAGQTNLLALNAAIEAAGAGVAGKGFAVVASEVKELARQASDSSEDIREKITGIQQSAERAVTAIGSIAEIIARVNDISASIASSVEEQSITSKEIAGNVTQTSKASEEVASNIQGISTATTEGARDARKTATASEDLQKLAKELNSIIGMFRISSDG